MVVQAVGPCNQLTCLRLTIDAGDDHCFSIGGERGMTTSCYRWAQPVLQNWSNRVACTIEGSFQLSDREVAPLFADGELIDIEQLAGSGRGDCGNRNRGSGFGGSRR
jgi:hypothetical protein